jgi:hypothetical protein
MEQFVENDLLHLVYTDKDKQKDVLGLLEMISNQVEGYLTRREGHNFPTELGLEAFEELGLKDKFLRGVFGRSSKYVIVYKKNDLHTKIHELQHAKFYLDEEFRGEVVQLWESIPSKKQNYITGMLDRMGYDRKVHLDEFQAYYFTEKKNFFGL